MEETTIAALATAPLPAGVAVIRVSGPRTRLALKALFRGKKDPLRTPRTLVFGDIIDFKTSAPLDKGLAVFMPGPKPPPRPSSRAKSCSSKISASTSKKRAR
jgi:tRNA modification GTPase